MHKITHTVVSYGTADGRYLVVQSSTVPGVQVPFLPGCLQDMVPGVQYRLRVLINKKTVYWPRIVRLLFLEMVCFTLNLTAVEFLDWIS